MRTVGVDTTLLARMRAWGLTPEMQAVYLCIRQTAQIEKGEILLPTSKAIAEDLGLSEDAARKVRSRIPADLFTIEALTGDKDLEKVEGNEYARLGAADLCRFYKAVHPVGGGWRTVMILVHLLTIMRDGGTPPGWRWKLKKRTGHTPPFLRKEVACLKRAGLLEVSGPKRGLRLPAVPAVPTPSGNHVTQENQKAPGLISRNVVDAAVPADLEGVLTLPLSEALGLIEFEPDPRKRAEMKKLYRKRLEGLYSIAGILSAVHPEAKDRLNETKARLKITTELEEKLDKYPNLQAARDALGQITPAESLFFPKREALLKPFILLPSSVESTGDDIPVGRIIESDDYEAPPVLPPLAPSEALSLINALLRHWETANREVMKANALSTPKDKKAAAELAVRINKAGWYPGPYEKELSQALPGFFRLMAEDWKRKQAGKPVKVRFSMVGVTKRYEETPDVLDSLVRAIRNGR